MLRRIALAVLLLVAVVPPVADAHPRRIGHRGRWLTDHLGRVVVFHGLNMVAKRPPYLPSALGFDEDDAAFLAAEGFNTVRLGIIYKGLEPTRGTYDDAYLDGIVETMRLLGEHGIRVLVDFHQDLFNERFSGEGFPDWAVQDDGLPAQPDLGFPGNYFAMPALWRAYDHFWANDPGPGGVGLQDAYAAAWRHVAERLRDEPALLGYDVFNETWPGSQWPTCLNPNGCPLFDARITTFFTRVFRAIREVDTRTMVFYETHPIFGGGADVHIGDTGDPRAGFSFHVYCLGATIGVPSELLGEAACPLGLDRPFERAQAQSERTGDALLLSEFGATDDLGSLARDLAAADRHMVSWQYWAYWNEDPCCERPHEGVIVDPAQPPAGDNLKQAKLDVLVRPYPRAIAGEPLSWSFDPAARRFELTYRARLGTTEVSVPARHYAGGYAVTIAGPGEVTSGPGAPVLTVRTTGAGTILVTVS